MLINKHFTGVKYLFLPSSTYYFHLKTNILTDFQFCIIVTLIRVNRKQLNILKIFLEYLEFYIITYWRWFSPKSCLTNCRRSYLNLIQMGLSGAPNKWKWGSLPPPSLNPLHITHNDEAWQNHLLLLWREIMGKMHNLWFFAFTEFSKVVLFSVVPIWMMSVKLVTPDHSHQKENLFLFLMTMSILNYGGSGSWNFQNVIFYTFWQRAKLLFFLNIDMQV